MGKKVLDLIEKPENDNPQKKTKQDSDEDEKSRSNGSLDDIESEVHDELMKIKDFTAKFSHGALTGHSGKSLKNIVSIGIGGSDLGPRMVTEALEFYKEGDQT